jgi:K+-transporting ATPase KdpF subunit
MDLGRRRQERVWIAQPQARRAHGRVMPTLLSISPENAGGLAVAALLLIYLVYALVRAERF